MYSMYHAGDPRNIRDRKPMIMYMNTDYDL